MSSAKSLPIAKLIPKGESLTQLSVTLSPCFAEGPDVYIGMFKLSSDDYCASF